MKKIIPVSLLAIWVACPAFAENFPNDGYMLENKTYDNAATYENMGVDSGSVDAVAEYANCPTNSYCDETGQHSCPSGYPNSAMGSSESTQCYTACTVANANIAHATAVSGNDYNGGTDTCSATACEDGYHTQAGSMDLYTIIGDSSGESNWDTGTFSVDYWQKGLITGKARCSSRGVSIPWYQIEGYLVPADHFVSTLPDSSGDNCYCQVDSFTPVDGETQSVSGVWVYNGSCSGVNPCESKCAYDMYSGATDRLAYRTAVLSATMVPGGATICAANTITINWSDVDGEENPYATSVTYDGDITTPVKAATKPGKQFVGWKFAPATPVFNNACSSDQDCIDSGEGDKCFGGICGWKAA